ncbi:4675_t:CDS:2 [Scutellospora calospora]|uniref:4675_t:CDS:1 n=1 Tax=Scutellospora calospora TaxID=85575 RepID=A0ACA9LIE0_9GLOM|nr:4675_t:CDS:2 [Scutellospora calospora]
MRTIPKKNYFQDGLPNEIMINTFKYIKQPMNLILSCKRWSFISKDSQTKAEWIIFQCGRAHCLFHAIRLGPTFISVAVSRAIITKGGILSRYFAQRLLIHYGNYDQKLRIKDYSQFCKDVNDLVLQGAILILLPPAQPIGSDVKAINERLFELIDLGFQLNYSNIFHLFEHRLDEVGKILIDSFAEIMKESQGCFLHKCLMETLKSTYKPKNENIQDFFYKYLPGTPESEFKRAFEDYSNSLNISHQNFNLRLS